MLENLESGEIPRIALKSNCDPIQKNVYREDPQLWTPQIAYIKLTVVKAGGSCRAGACSPRVEGVPGRAGAFR